MGRDDHHHQRQAVDVFLHADEHLENFFRVFVHQFVQIKEMIVASNAELQQSLTDLGVQADKAKEEIVKRIADLEAALANAGGTTPEVDAALEALKGKVQSLDDLNPDATP